MGPRDEPTPMGADDGPDDAGPQPEGRPIEPGTPRIEHAAFVVLGAVLTVLAFLRGLGLI